MRLDVNEDRAIKRVVHKWLMSGTLHDYIRKDSKGSSLKIKKILQRIVMRIPFPSGLSLTQ